MNPELESVHSSGPPIIPEGQGKQEGGTTSFGMSGMCCHRDVIALENGHLLPFRKCVCCACTNFVSCNEWVCVSVSIFWGPLQSVLIFHPYNFYSTESVHENEMDIFFRKRREKTQDTSGVKGHWILRVSM